MVLDWGRFGTTVNGAYRRLSAGWQLLLTGLAGVLLAVGGWLTWGAQMEGMYRRLGDGGQMGVTVAAAFLFYVAPSFYLTALAFITLFVLLALRPVWGLALIAVTIPFHLEFQKVIGPYTFSLLEIFTLVTFAAFLCHWGVVYGAKKAHEGAKAQRRRGTNDTPHAPRTLSLSRVEGTHHASRPIHPADYVVLALLLVATLSLFFTERLDGATNEWRWLILEPAIF